jgi:hypothetical protein
LPPALTAVLTHFADHLAQMRTEFAHERQMLGNFLGTIHQLSDRTSLMLQEAMANSFSQYQLLAAQNTGVISQLACFEEARNAAWHSAQAVITTAVSRLTDVSADAGAALRRIADRPAEAPVDITAFATLLCANSQSQLQRLLESTTDRQEGMFQKLLAAFVEHATTVARANRAARPTVQRIMTGPRPIIVEVPPSRQQSVAHSPEASPPRVSSPTAPSVAEPEAAAPTRDVHPERTNGETDAVETTTSPPSRKSCRREDSSPDARPPL